MIGLVASCLASAINMDGMIQVEIVMEMILMRLSASLSVCQKMSPPGSAVNANSDRSTLPEMNRTCDALLEHI